MKEVTTIGILAGLAALIALIWYAMQPIATAPNVPARQVQLVQVLNELRKDYEVARSNSNEIQQNKIAEVQKKFLCNVAGDPSVHDWTGEVHKVSVTSFVNQSRADAKNERASGGGASIQVQIAKNIWVETWGGALSEYGEQPTNVPRGTPLFEMASSLKKSDKIRFSGEFVVKDGCLIERSLTQNGAMTEPELIFRFTQIRKNTD